MTWPNDATRSGQSTPARDLSQAIPLSLFPTPEVAIPRKAEAPGKVAIPRKAESSLKVAIPRKADGSLKVAIPGETATDDAWAIPRKRAGDATPGTRAGKLKLKESGRGARKSWTIRTSRESGEALRVRRSDAGYAVSLRFRDQSETLREPYLCYLSASEWSEAKQGSLKHLVSRISEKMRRRKDAPLLVELISRLEAKATGGPVESFFNKDERRRKTNGAYS